ncbi:MAG TPA: pseudouridine synthase [Candidatus Saccharimonadales bacterium]|nr:pseudouridine synthase [Candidatus Saccharimonadales bacterium]
MRINRYIALCSGLSRRAVDQLISHGHVQVNNIPATIGSQVTDTDHVTLDGKPLQRPVVSKTVLLNKPVGYVCSRNGQGSKTIYDLLPAELHALKPVGRLDKDSSGLILLTTDGALAQKLTHPSQQKQKVYRIELDKPLQSPDQHMIGQGIRLEDGLSRLKLTGHGRLWVISMHEGRNRQIRRTFAALGYTVRSLHRTQFGPYLLNPTLLAGSFLTL